MKSYATIALVPLFALVGCTTGTGARWYAPGTWFSHAPAAAVDAAVRTESIAEKAAVKAAQRATHQTSVALAAAPASRPVEVATESNATAIGLLDQAAGPLDAAELARIRTMVAGLLSDNAELRAKAERDRASQSKDIAEIAVRLTKAQAATEKAEEKLRSAFDRENALANELRSQRALVWIAGGVAVLAAAGWVYVKFFLGGFPSAIGAAVRDLRAKDPKLAETVAPFYAKYLNRHEQEQIKKHAST